jgi:Outer membrane receptor proteins, mostly Fe transport
MTNKRMRYITRIFLLILAFGYGAEEIFAQNTWVITGRISDIQEGYALPGAVVRSTTPPMQVGYTNSEGWYRLELPERDITLEISCNGYKTEQVLILHSERKQRIDFGLASLAYTLPDAIIRGESPGQRLRRADMGIERVSSLKMKSIPLLMGEPDILKAVQMMPGVQMVSEGSSGYLVRGGSPDQNLVLFDQATVYNPSHMLGFFSVFNNDAVGNVELYKGDISASHGGRLSSLLQVEGKDGGDEFGVNGGIGLISSRLSIGGPIKNSGVNYLLAARRTYADIFLPLYHDTVVNNTVINFYDINAKLRWRINNNHSLSLSFYNGNDRFKNLGLGFNFGNSTASLVWNSRFSRQFFAKFSLLGAEYRYDFKGITPSLESRWLAGIKELSLRTDFNYVWNEQTNTRFGWVGTFQWFRPGRITGVFISGGQRDSSQMEMSRRQALLNHFYVSQEHRLFDQRLNLRYGLRLTRFDNVGPGTQYDLDKDYNLIGEGRPIASGEFYHHEYGLEPRMALSYVLNDSLSVKASYSRTLQYVHLLSFSTTGSPLDVWIPANPSIRPQSAHQFAFGVFKGFFQNQFQVSAEAFYKSLNNVMDFKDHPNILLYDKVETEVRFGKGESYGVEFSLKKDEGKLTGWINYTWLRSFRTIQGVNHNKRYSAPADRPHNVSIVLSYKIGSRIETSVNWIYNTGQPFVMPEGRFWVEGEFVPIYSERNAYRMPDYHRMDASIVIRLGKLNRKFQNDLNISVYNLYGRKNPWMINYRMNSNGEAYAEMTYLFSFVPSITWNFSF